MAPAAKSETAEPQQRRTNIPRLYQEACANCHGDKGQGGGAGTSTLITEELFKQDHDKRFFDAIKNGVPEMAMPAYGDSSTDEEIWALVVYVRELQKAGLRSKWGSTDEDGVNQTQHHSFRVETVIPEGQGLQIPWAIDWLPDGRALVTNRPGGMMLFQGERKIADIEGVPDVLHLGQGGMMEVAVHPDYARNGWIYLGYAEPKADGSRAALTKIVRGKLRGSQWVNQETIFEASQDNYTRAGVHFGVRIVFDGKGHIYFSIGDRGAQSRAQELDRPNGKVFRVKEDGSIPSDNPFVGQPGAIEAIWSYGHRNPQGLAFDRQGKLWDTEHAPRGGDEVNLIQKGKNYGWPEVSFAMNYSGTPFRTPWPSPDQDFVMPNYRWLPSTGVCGLDVGRGTKFPRWNNDLLAGGLSGQNVDRVRIRNGRLVEREEILHGLGRVRDVVVGPDDFVYVVLNQPDKVIRLVPAR